MNINIISCETEKILNVPAKRKKNLGEKGGKFNDEEEDLFKACDNTQITQR